MEAYSMQEVLERPCETCNKFYMDHANIGCKHKRNTTRKLLPKNTFICYYLWQDKMESLENEMKEFNKKLDLAFEEFMKYRK